MTSEEILNLIAPPKEVEEKIVAWIEHRSQAFPKAGGLKITPLRDAIRVTASVELIEALFSTQLFEFASTIEKAVVVKHLGELSVPVEFGEHIQMVTGITEFPPPRRPLVRRKPANREAQQGNAECNTPYSIKNLYNISQDLIVTNKSASQAPYAQSSGDEGFGRQDLADWQEANGLSSNPVENILGNNADKYVPRENDGEAQLDIQLLTGIAPGANTSFWIMTYENGWMFEWALEIFNTPDAPWVNSISYGWYEIEQCDEDGGPGVGNCTGLNFANSKEYIERTNEEFMKLGAKGFTLLAASGDDGVEPTFDCTQMKPNYPASSPYVVSVGATAVIESDKAIDSFEGPPICTDPTWYCQCSTSTLEEPAMETNNAEFDTGGGFSGWIPRPPYQDAAIKSYLANNSIPKPDVAKWNQSNRGYPDIAAVGGNVAVIGSKEIELVGGTSASCPIIGALITLLNQDQLLAGKPVLGFVNPLLYMVAEVNPQAFKDITVGSNCQRCPKLAFHSGAGWDPLTGLGVPNFAEIRKTVNSILNNNKQ